MDVWAQAPRVGALPVRLLLLMLIGEAQSVIGRSTHANIDVLVGTNISMEIGDNMTLSKEITWMKSSVVIAWITAEGVQITGMYKDRLVAPRSGSIVISNAMLSDSGNYTASTNTLPPTPAVATFQVNVYELIGAVSGISVPPEVQEGDATVTLTCQITAGTGTVTWTKNGQVIMKDSRYIVVDKTLTITKPSRTDAGFFVCNISNPFDSGSASLNLTVNYGPDINNIIVASNTQPFSQEFVLVNSAVNLTCSAASYPVAEYSWILGYITDETVPFGPTLSLPNIQFTQAGRYYCLAYNSKTKTTKQKQINIDVYELPLGGPQCTLQAANNNSALQFLCSWPTGSPKPKLSFSGLSVSTPFESLADVNEKPVAGLSGKSIVCMGNYTVPSLNQNCTITPEAPNVTRFFMQAYSVVGDTVSVALNFNGKFNPGTVKWFGPTSQSLSQGGRYNISPDTTTLTISNFSLENDLGNYSFICQNPLGEKSQALNLIGPYISSCSATRSTDGNSTNISWTVASGAVITSIMVQMQGSPLARATTGDWEDLQSMGSANGSYVVSGLDPTQSYSFRVTPMFGSKRGTPSDMQTVNPTRLSAGAIAGIVVGSVLGALLIVLLLILIICCVRKKGQRGRTSKTEGKKKQSKKANGLAPVEGKAPVRKARWDRPSISSPTLTNGPPDYEIHSSMFRNTSISTISATPPMNGTEGYNINQPVIGPNKHNVKHAPTTV
ncbi:V-set and immunoglobulin domain-containing protein 10-like isoform X1 [Ambystoma mexicanum]|uniref:V-set and immunoglobulin domain-containing protein 10-like isoform X1 n=1 Tax=Ambystoma mexicanum TaxID=8296 RepID=UPI0037E808F8